jgi:curved DNA-binding protein CbpA
MTPNSEFSGTLADTPVFAVLRRICLEKRTGQLLLAREAESRHLLFTSGALRLAMSSQADHRLGAYLLRWGYITESDLTDALEEQRSTMARLDTILVERGRISAEALAGEMKRLIQTILFSTFGWTTGTFEFRSEQEADALGSAVSLSTESLIVEGIRRTPESVQVLEYLGDLSRVPVVCSDLLSREGLELAPEIGHFLGLVDGKTDARSILKLGGGSQLANARALYALVYSGLVSIDGTCARPAPRTPTPAPRLSISAGLSDLDRRHRQFVLNTFGRLAWLSHYDVLGISDTASAAEIESAYGLRSSLFRPEQAAEGSLADCGHELQVLTRRVREARGVLSDPAARETYDREVRQGKVLTQQAHESGTPQATGKDAVGDTKLRAWTASQNYKRAVQLIALKDFFPAIQLLEQAVSFVPDNPEYRYKLGMLERKNPHWLARAVLNLREAVRLDPLRAEALAELAEALLQTGQAGEARPFAAQARKLAPDSTEYIALDEKITHAMAGPATALRKPPPGGILSRFNRGSH